MAIDYPIGVDTPQAKAAYLLRVKEYVRLVYNMAGEWRRDGLTRDEYDNGVGADRLHGKKGLQVKMPDRMKALFPYRDVFTMDDSKKYRSVCAIVHSEIDLAIGRNIRAMEASDAHDVDIDLNAFFGTSI